jgi:hypothetical protein
VGLATKIVVSHLCRHPAVDKITGVKKQRQSFKRSGRERISRSKKALRIHATPKEVEQSRQPQVRQSIFLEWVIKTVHHPSFPAVDKKPLLETKNKKAKG